ncbi:hypothetical protein P3H15_54695, partial [Rhodococcus sp. T2V]|uniref:hypothetical protein n=1 Tax=Rhodococcus sp. T2V TaxID=3034164 RepID=UPI0023E10432
MSVPDPTTVTEAPDRSATAVPYFRFRPHPLPEPVMPSNDPLLSPFDLKHLRLKNRVVSTSH